jgi:hypothetical protein
LSRFGAVVRTRLRIARGFVGAEAEQFSTNVRTRPITVSPKTKTGVSPPTRNSNLTDAFAAHALVRQDRGDWSSCVITRFISSS